MTSQYLNLTKNSSLAVIIGYPDLVSIANTTINQTGQAVEGIAMIMAVYLAISLLISLLDEPFTTAPSRWWSGDAAAGADNDWVPGSKFGSRRRPGPIFSLLGQGRNGSRPSPGWLSNRYRVMTDIAEPTYRLPAEQPRPPSRGAH